MTRSALTLIQSAFARIACAQQTAHHLQALRDSVDQACALPPGEAWEDKAAAHAQFHCLLADAAGAAGFALLARFISGSLHDLIVQARPSTEGFIITSHRHLLGHLETRDAEAAAREMEDHISWLSQAGDRRAPETTSAPAT